MSQKDYYKILDVDKKASKEEIKRAFYKLAAKYHPDKKGGDEAKFKEVNEAYQVLSNDQKRKEYDSFGQTFSGAGSNAGGGAGGFGGFNQGQGFGGFDFSGFNQGDFQNMDFDLGDIFGDIFGGGFSSSGSRAREKRGRDMSLEMDISFEESIFGVERRVAISRTATCKTCHGTGAEPGTKMETCPKCDGAGQILQLKRTIFGQMETYVQCSECHGTGKIPKVKCKTCHGKGVANDKEEILIKVPAGIENGQTLRMNGFGEAVQGGKTGDLYITILVKQNNKIWKREGVHLIITQDIKLTDALLGRKYSISGLDGEVEFEIPKGTNTGDIIKVKGRGVPNRDRGRGDILIKINVQIPKKLSKKEEDLVRELKSQGL